MECGIRCCRWRMVSAGAGGRVAASGCSDCLIDVSHCPDCLIVLIVRVRHSPLDPLHCQHPPAPVSRLQLAWPQLPCLFSFCRRPGRQRPAPSAQARVSQLHGGELRAKRLASARRPRAAANRTWTGSLGHCSSATLPLSTAPTATARSIHIPPPARRCTTLLSAPPPRPPRPHPLSSRAGVIAAASCASGWGRPSARPKHITPARALSAPRLHTASAPSHGGELPRPFFSPASTTPAFLLHLLLLLLLPAAAALCSPSPFPACPHSASPPTLLLRFPLAPVAVHHGLTLCSLEPGSWGDSPASITLVEPHKLRC